MIKGTKVKVVEDGKIVTKIRPHDRAGYVEFDLNNPNPAWTQAYREWLARQALKDMSR